MLPDFCFCKITCSHFSVCILAGDQHLHHLHRSWPLHPETNKVSIMAHRIRLMPVFPLLLKTYIIADEIRMIFLNAVVQNGYYYTFPRVTLSPGFFSIQVLMRRVGLQDTVEFYLPVNLL